jgi:hypothetical protein
LHLENWQARRNQGADHFTSLLKVGLDAFEALHALIDRVITDRAHILFTLLSVLGALIIPIIVASPQAAHEIAAFIVFFVELCIQGPLEQFGEERLSSQGYAAHSGFLQNVAREFQIPWQRTSGSVTLQTENVGVTLGSA